MAGGEMFAHPLYHRWWTVNVGGAVPAATFVGSQGRFEWKFVEETNHASTNVFKGGGPLGDNLRYRAFQRPSNLQQNFGRGPRGRSPRVEVQTRPSYWTAACPPC